MYIFGYYYGRFPFSKSEYKYKQISDFCSAKGLPKSAIFSDDDHNRYDYIALKKLLKDKDILIITNLNDLGANKKERLHELLYLVDKNVRIMVLDRPDTLFDFPGISQKEIDMYYDNIHSSNHLLIQSYANATHQKLEFSDKSSKSKCRVSHNGVENDLHKNEDPVHYFMFPNAAPPVLIKASRSLAMIEAVR